MTPTPHGQVPEALIDLIDAYAETRHRCGGIYNPKTEAARNAVIEALSGVQALSAAPVVPRMSAAEVNNLPAHVHAYIHQLASLCDPAGMVRENMQLLDTNNALQKMYRRAADACADVFGCFVAAESEGLKGALSDTTDERLKDLVERRLMYAMHAVRDIAASPTPLIGQPQAMPDLSALTERGAKAWTGVDAQALREGRWYMVTHDGVATLCEDRRDAEKEAKDADMAWPHSGPHRAVQLVEASTAGFTAADMATASAQGFRDGVASLSANAGEPVAWQYRSLRDNGAWFDCTKERFEMRCTQPEIWETRALCTPPPTAQAEVENLRKALQFYADKQHFAISEEDAWDTAMVEDGSIAKMALAAEHLKAFAQFSGAGDVWVEGEVAFARAVLAKWGAPQPALDCHHRPPCDECAAIAAQGGKT